MGNQFSGAVDMLIFFGLLAVAAIAIWLWKD